MNVRKRVGALMLGLLIATPYTFAAETAATPSDAKAKAEQSKPKAQQPEASSQNETGFTYRPPMRGAPAARIGGGTRGTGAMAVELAVLAPDHTGLTTKDQPTLYWYVSQPVPARLEVTVINDAAVDPALEKAIESPRRAGIQSIDLTQTSVRLKPGIEYRWFVSVVADPEQRSNDIVASGTIERIAPEGAFKNKIVGADERSLARLYAQEGVWYDTIDALSRLIEKAPADSTLREERAALLEQVGLKSVADYTRAH